MALPNPGGFFPIPGVDLPDVNLPGPSLDPRNYIPNPFEWVLDKIRGLFLDLGKLFQDLIINPPRPEPGPWRDYLYGNALGVAPTIATAVCIVLVVVSMIWNKKVVSAGQAFVIAVLLAALGPAFFAFTDVLIASGTQLAEIVRDLYDPKTSGGNGFFALPDIVNPLGAIAGYFTASIAGAILVSIFIIYQLIIIGVVFVFLIVVALIPLGTWAEKLAGWLLSIGLVAMVFGQAAAILCLELGQIAIDNMPAGIGGNSFVATVLLTGSILLAIAAQVLLIWGTHTGVVKAKGFIGSQVRGRVETYTQQRHEVDVKAFDLAHMGSVVPIPVKPVGSFSEAGGPDARQAYESGLMLAAVRIHPAAGAAAAAASAVKPSPERKE